MRIRGCCRRCQISGSQVLSTAYAMYYLLAYHLDYLLPAYLGSS